MSTLFDTRAESRSCNPCRVTRNSPGCHVFFFLLAILFTVGGIHAKEAQNYRARAYLKKTGKLMFTERHKREKVKGRSAEVVYYYDLKGKLIAKKIIYDSKDFTPETHFHDFRDEHYEGVIPKRNSYELLWKRNRNEPLKRATVRARKNVCNIAGFIRFLQKNWEPLLTGKMFKLEVLLPTELDAYTFRMKYIRTIKYRGEKVAIFRADMSNFLFRLLTDAIYFGINVETKRPAYYDGIYFVRNDENWKATKLKIVYDY